MMSGGQCVMMVGMPLMLQWCVGNWDMHTLEVHELITIKIKRL